MKRAPTGLADLARALKAINPTRRDCPAIAKLLGLEGDLIFQGEANEEARSLGEFRPVSAPDVQSEEIQEADPSVAAETPPVDSEPTPESLLFNSEFQRRRPPERPRRSHQRRLPQVARPTGDEMHRPTSLTRLHSPASAGMPPSVEKATEIEYYDVARHLSEPEPVVSDAQLRALVSALLSVPRLGEPDLDKIVAALSTAKPLRKLPRKTRAGIVQHVHVIIDTADAMRLFQSDATRALRAIRRVAGGALRSETLIHGPPETKDFSFAPGSVVLVMSALGVGGSALGEDLAEDRWCHLAGTWASQRLRPVAMVPWNPTRWPRDLPRHSRLVFWHPPGARARSATPRELGRLAQVLSLAAVIDPALLRAARRRILPNTDAGTEVDFARAHWVAAWNPRVISLFPEAVEGLRSEIAADGELLGIAKRILDRQRRDADESWDRVLFEENLVFVALNSSNDDYAALEATLTRVIKTLMVRTKDTVSARWALSFLNELPEAARGTRAAKLLRAVASMLLATAPEYIAKIAASEDAGWIFQERIAVSVRWDGEHITIRRPVEGESALEVPLTLPLIVMVSEIDGSHRKVLRFTLGRLLRDEQPYPWTPAPTLPRFFKTIDGAVYRLDDATFQWAKARASLANKTTILGLIRRRDGDLFEVDIGLPATMSESTVLLGGGDPSQLEGQELQVCVTYLEEASREIHVRFGSRIHVSPSLWNWFQKCQASFQHVRVRVDCVGLKLCRVVVQGFNTILPFDQLGKNDQSAEGLLGRELDFQVLILTPEQSSVTVTRRLISENNWRHLRTAYEAQTSVSGTIAAVSTAGFKVNLRGGIRGFLPRILAKELTTMSAADLVNRTYDLNVTTLEENGRKVILDHNKTVWFERVKRRRRYLETIQVGDVVQGTVKNFTNSGAFIDLGEMDGLLQISDISWGRLSHPSELLHLGQELNVKVLAIDFAKNHILLGLRQLALNPWDRIEERFPVGKRVKAKITNVVPYGLFVQLEEQIAGLIHISELSWTRTLVRLAGNFTIGQEIEAAVLGVDRDKQHISLSVRQLVENPWDSIARKYPLGALVKGTVLNMTAYGVFVKIEDGIEGMVHSSDISWNRKITNLNELFKKGDEVMAKVINIDQQNQRISLSIKHLTKDPWDDIVSHYRLGDVVVAKVRKIASFGVFMALEHDIDGLVHVSQFGDVQSAKVKDSMTLGQEVQARVIKVEEAERRIGLSIKALHYGDEELRHEIESINAAPADDGALESE